LATVSDSSIPFPLQILGRAVKQRPTFLLGLYGVRSLAIEKTVVSSEASSADDACWNYSLNMATDSMAIHWGNTPTLIPCRELFVSGTSASNTRNRYTDAESIARWRSLPLCVLDLGCDSTEAIKKYGRQCDGVAMIVLDSLHVAKKRLHQLRRDAIPWIGYWTVALRAHSGDNPAIETVRKAA
jgi:hypothetical protein